MQITELAWSAGFFDGEGSTTLAVGKGKGGPFISLRVPQSGGYAKEVLERFKAAVGGLGQIYGPYKTKHKDAYHWVASNFEHAQAVIAMLWNYLGPQKREQAKQALLVMRNKQESPSMAPEARSARASKAAKALWAQRKAA